MPTEPQTLDPGRRVSVTLTATVEVEVATMGEMSDASVTQMAEESVLDKVSKLTWNVTSHLMKGDN